MKRRTLIAAAVCLVAVAHTAQGFSYRQERIPNVQQGLVPNPFSGSGSCQSIGHVSQCGGSPSGGGNAFGRNFVDVGDERWTETVCTTDSDTDGKTNGDELGDPCCIWTEGSGTARFASDVSHPGVDSSTTSRASCSTTPAALADFAASVNGDSSQITLTWTAPALTASCHCSLTIQASLDGGGFTTVDTSSLDPDSVTFSFPTSGNYGEYTVRIAANNHAGTSTVSETTVTAVAPGSCGGVSACPENEECDSDQCVCIDGYQRDDEDVCQPLCGDTLCGENQECSSSDTCVCVDGYAFEDGECKSECETTTCSASENRECGIEDGSWECVCVSGHEEDLAGDCVELCGDVICGDDADCIDDSCVLAGSSVTMGPMTVTWNLIDDDTAMQFTVEATTPSWAAFGISPNGGMLNSDVVVAWVTSEGELVMSDRYTRAKVRSGVVSDASQDITPISGSRTDDKITFSFSRPLDTGDSADDVVIGDEVVTLIWAVGQASELAGLGSDPDALLSQHLGTNRGNPTDVNLLSSASGDDDDDSTSDDDDDDDQDDNTVQLGPLDVSWVVNEADNKITFTVTHEVDSWIAFGVSPGGTMVGADIIVAWTDGDGNLVASDRKNGAKSASAVAADESQDITIESSRRVGTRDGHVTSFVVSRPLDSGDADDTPITDSEITVIWAHGRDGEADSLGSDSTALLAQHARSNRGNSDRVNFFTGASSEQSQTDLTSTHGTLMFVGWGVLLPMGILIARFFKRYDPTWFKLHRGLQMTGLLITIIAFILIIIQINDNDGDHFDFTHANIGLTVMILGILQPINAAMRPGKTAENRPTWNLLHWWTGRIAVILAAVNIFLGLDLFESDDVYFVLVGVWYALLAILAGVFFFMKNAAGKVEPSSPPVQAQSSE